jgi:hypothetical protein
VNKKEQAVEQQRLLVALALLLGNRLHLLGRGPTSFERRLLKQFEESVPVLAKFPFVSFLQEKRSTLMEGIPHLHVSVPHAEKPADFLVLLLPIFPLTILGIMEGGLAYRAVQLRRCNGFIWA